MIMGWLWPIVVGWSPMLRMLTLGLVDENIDFALQFDGGFLEVLYIGDSRFKYRIAALILCILPRSIKI